MKGVSVDNNDPQKIKRSQCSFQFFADLNAEPELTCNIKIIHSRNTIHFDDILISIHKYGFYKVRFIENVILILLSLV